MIRLGKNDIEFQKVYTTYGANIQRLLKGMTGNDAVADELTQEAFTKAWVNLSQFGFRSSLRTWIYQVAINVGRDWLRSHKNRTPSLVEDLENENQKDKEAVQEGLSELSDEARELLILFYWEGMGVDEISKILGIPIGTVKSRLYTGRMKLKEVMLLKGYDV